MTIFFRPEPRVFRGHPPGADLARAVLYESAMPETAPSIPTANPNENLRMIPSSASLSSPSVSVRSPEDVFLLVSKNQGLVHKAVERILGNWAPEDDPDAAEEWRKELTMDGQKGLRRAAEKYDPARGTQFSTYAMPWISKYVREAAEELRETYFHVSLDKPVADGEDSSATLGDLIACDDAEDPFESVARAADCEWARELLDALPPRERSIVARYHGLDGLSAQTFNQIAEDDGVSTQCTNRIYQRAILSMRKLVRPAA